MAVDPARAKSLFLSASDLSDPAERAAYLERECGANAELRARVEALLRANEGAPSPPAGTECPTIDSDAAQPPTEETGAPTPTPGEFRPDRTAATLDHADPDATTAASPAAPPQQTKVPSDEAIGTVIAGRYRLVEVIGEGGMGSVYLASQSEPVKRQVALKLIKMGLNSRDVLARFDAERQALALMDHPNIARIYDGGVTAGGQPFFVMELVDGAPLTDYCDQKRLRVKARLELFVAVCQAVQHAHQKGIIHRDLKPGNVLVSDVDGKPLPKVIDFGVAKATEVKLTDMSFTDVGAIVGTPAYMSPEQADPTSMDIDTRTDVYALGVMLYELLTGAPPIDARQFRRGAILEMLRMVREVDPQRPSTKLSTAEALPNIAANRSIEPARLAKLLQGELDCVVMKALEKDRTQRYDTANGFARDIQRYLADEVVEARPPSRGYRLKKFVKRNKGQVIAASLVFFALMAGIVGTSFGLIRANHAATAERLAKREAVAKRKEAERNLAFAKKGNEILGSVFAGLDPKAEYATVAELRNALRDDLTKAVKELDGSAIGDPLEVAAMQSILGKSLQGLGEYDLAVEVLQKASDTIKAQLGPDHPDTLSSMSDLAVGYGAAGKLNLALSLFEETLKLKKARLGPEHINTLTGMNNLAHAYQAAGKLDLALSLFEETLKLEKARLGPEHSHTIHCMSNLAQAYREAGRYDDALPLLEESLARIKARLGPDHPETFTSMLKLAEGYLVAGKLEQALPLCAETLRLAKARLGPEHPDTLHCMSNLAEGYRAAGKLDQALPLLEETLALTKVRLGPDHPYTLQRMNKLALGYLNVGQHDKALPLFEETLRLMTAKLGPDNPHTIACMGNLALGYQAVGQHDKALPLFEETLKLTAAKVGPDHPDTLTSMNNLALGYQYAERPEKALALFEETLKLRRAKLGSDHPNTLQSMDNLAASYWRQKRLDKSVPLFEELLPLREKKLGRGHPDTLWTVANLGVNYKDAGRLLEGLPLLEEAYRASKKYPTLRWVASQLINGYVKAGENTKLADLLQERLAEARIALPKDSPQLAGLLAQLGLSLLQQKKWTEAETLLRESLASREKTQPDSWTTFNTQSLIGGSLLGQKKYADAEPLLLAGYEGMKKREAAIPEQSKIRLPEAVDRLIELYTATDKPDELKKWQTERAKYSEASSRMAS